MDREQEFRESIRTAKLQSEIRLAKQAVRTAPIPERRSWFPESKPMGCGLLLLLLVLIPIVVQSAYGIIELVIGNASMPDFSGTISTISSGVSTGAALLVSVAVPLLVFLVVSTGAAIATHRLLVFTENQVVALGVAAEEGMLGLVSLVSQRGIKSGSAIPVVFRSDRSLELGKSSGKKTPLSDDERELLKMLEQEGGFFARQKQLVQLQQDQDDSLSDAEREVEQQKLAIKQSEEETLRLLQEKRSSAPSSTGRSMTEMYEDEMAELLEQFESSERDSSSITYSGGLPKRVI